VNNLKKEGDKESIIAVFIVAQLCLAGYWLHPYEGTSNQHLPNPSSDDHHQPKVITVLLKRHTPSSFMNSTCAA
jgi:hypothetical protein